MRPLPAPICMLLAACITAMTLAGAWAEPSADEKHIAISFDDAPRGPGPVFSADERAARLIAALERAGVEQAAFFVNPAMIERADRAGAEERLAAYAHAGHVLANHTDTHPRLQATEPEAFLADIDAAEAWLVDQPGRRAWFRFPFLDEGGPDAVKRDAVRAGLRERGLLNARVTVNASDWVFEQALSDTPADERDLVLEALSELYVSHHVAAAEFYDALSRRLTGRSVAHMLLLHENDLAALNVEALAAALRAHGWTIISADAAYADPIYASDPETRYAQGTLLERLAWRAGLEGEVWFQGNEAEALRSRIENELHDDGAR